MLLVPAGPVVSDCGLCSEITAGRKWKQGHSAAVRDAGRRGSTQHSDLPQPSSAGGRRGGGMG